MGMPLRTVAQYASLLWFAACQCPAKQEHSHAWLGATAHCGQCGVRLNPWNTSPQPAARVRARPPIELKESSDQFVERASNGAHSA